MHWQSICKRKREIKLEQQAVHLSIIHQIFEQGFHYQAEPSKFTLLESPI